MAGDKRLYRGVVVKMLALIESGEYPAGGRLPPERELAERFSVSRPTIREAIIALEAQDRVRVKTGSGVYVLEHPDSTRQSGNQPAVSTFELTEARALIEGEAAALAAVMINDDQLAQLEAALHDMADESADGTLHSELADKKFHQIISQATCNPILAKIIDDLWYMRDNVPTVHQAYQSICETDGQRRIDEHRAIFDALKQRDAGQARKAMHDHFSRILNKLIAAKEAEQMEEIRRKAEASRKRFSLQTLRP
ncbi:FadR/GntR family transcriptional regulator [Acanthopleuribacter pedis]|uniref:FadR family transcriptional regulator n=1 Tax=Acanthopleuribacter pedis TaxID=442870 RepID=A0A8J7U5P0_9BACT|nr:FadR/GntR family transcriptional regulator [Acanthopleuribacter pedis]MBO1321917.1 FadR family transcriptional regulator [Acanthopleuribacter pedis]